MLQCSIKTAMIRLVLLCSQSVCWQHDHRYLQAVAKRPTSQSISSSLVNSTTVLMDSGKQNIADYHSAGELSSGSVKPGKVSHCSCVILPGQPALIANPIVGDMLSLSILSFFNESFHGVQRTTATSCMYQMLVPRPEHALGANVHTVS